MNPTQDRPNLLSPQKLVELYPSIKLRTLRYWIQHAEARVISDGGRVRRVSGNGLDSALVRKGRITLIDENRFLDWLYREAE